MGVSSSLVLHYMLLKRFCSKSSKNVVEKSLKLIILVLLVKFSNSNTKIIKNSLIKQYITSIFLHHMDRIVDFKILTYVSYVFSVIPTVYIMYGET